MAIPNDLLTSHLDRQINTNYLFLQALASQISSPKSVGRQIDTEVRLYITSGSYFQKCTGTITYLFCVRTPFNYTLRMLESEFFRYRYILGPVHPFFFSQSFRKV